MQPVAPAASCGGLSAARAAVRSGACPSLLLRVQVIRHPRDGTLTSLDFGPIGGRDIAFTPARESLWAWGRKRLARRAVPVPKGTPGEVREMAVRHVPAGLGFRSAALDNGICHLATVVAMQTCIVSGWSQRQHVIRDLNPGVLFLQLMELPESSLFVGRTKLSMRDIRSFNSLQNNLYLLHKSDCR